MDQESRRLGLKWKIGGIYTGMMVVLGAFVIAAVSLLTQSTLRDQLDKRALAIVTNFSDAAARVPLVHRSAGFRRASGQGRQPGPCPRAPRGARRGRT